MIVIQRTGECEIDQVLHFFTPSVAHKYMRVYTLLL